MGNPNREAQTYDSKLLHADITELILKAFYQIHSDLGFGFLEKAYINALCVLLRQYGLKVEREVPFDLIYLGETVGSYRADVIVEGKVLVEGQSAVNISRPYLVRTRSYLKVAKLEVGLLLNWGPDAQFKRMFESRR